MCILTSRLRLRPFTLNDTESLADILADERVMAHSINGVMSKAQTRDFIKSCKASYQEYGFGPGQLRINNTKTY